MLTVLSPLLKVVHSALVHFIFSIICFVEHRDDGVPFQYVLPSPSLRVQARSVHVIASHLQQ